MHGAGSSPRLGRIVDVLGTEKRSIGDGRIGRAHVSARARVAVSFAAGFIALGISIFLTSWQVAVLSGWNAAAVVFIGWVWLSIGRLDGAETARVATIEDDSRAASDLVLIAASLTSLVGVALALLKANGETGAVRGLTTAVASLSLVLAWGAVHTVFTLRYASHYYLHGGGIDFKDDRPPDYGDFAYLAFTVGMTYQVSDTDVSSKSIRMTILRHAFLSFVFGTGVVAMTINIVAGLFLR
jgi:uncharacterized membrane protein